MNHAAERHSKQTSNRASNTKEGKRETPIRNVIKTLLVAVLFVALLRALAFASYHIPSESMVPTLEVGDRILVNKLAYGYSRHSLPFSDYFPRLPGKYGRVFNRLPKRGDVVVFKNPVNGEVTIKRLIGLPGDRVKLVRGRLIINNVLVSRKRLRIFKYRAPNSTLVAVKEYREELPNGSSHKIVERSDDDLMDDTSVQLVPDGHLFFLGDNRDNSNDSRYVSTLGFVPIENIIGRADLIPFSLYSCRPEAAVQCSKRRFFTWIE